MLQNLREHVQGWIAIVIATILCLAFALWGIEYYLSTAKTHPPVAKVNGQEITAQQLDTAYNRLRNSLHLPPGASAESNSALQKQLKDSALQQLILQAVLSQAATKEGYMLSNPQIGELIAQVPAFQINQKFSPLLYQRFVHQYFGSEENFINHIKQDSMVLQAKQGILSTAFVLPAETDRDVQLTHQQRDFAYVVIPQARFLAGAKIPDNAPQAYYAAHPDEFMMPEQITVQYIVLSNDKVAAQATVSPAELEQYLQSNPALKAHDPQVRQQAEKTLRQQKIDQLLLTQSDQLANLTYTNPDSLKPAAEALGLPIETLGPFTREGIKTGILANPKVLTAVLSDSVLKDKNNSDLIPLDEHSVVVVRVAEDKPATVKPFAEVRDAIIKKLQLLAAQDAAKALGQQIQSELQKGAALSREASAHQLQEVQKSQISRDNKDLPAPILTLAFSVPPATAGQPAVSGVALQNGDYVVLQLQKMQNGAATYATPAERAATTKKLALTEGTWEYYLYANQHMQAAKIKFY